MKARLQWVQLYQRTGNASLVCRRCGISYPTFLKWWQRYQAQGVAGLQDHNRRRNVVRHPKCSSNTVSGFCNCASANWELDESGISASP